MSLVREIGWHELCIYIVGMKQSFKIGNVVKVKYCFIPYEGLTKVEE